MTETNKHPNNYDSFTAFLEVSGVINNSNGLQFANIVKNIIQTLNNFNNGYDLLYILKRTIIQFIFNLIFEGNNNIQNLSKIKQGISKELFKELNPMYVKLHETDIEEKKSYLILPKGTIEQLLNVYMQKIHTFFYFIFFFLHFF